MNKKLKTRRWYQLFRQENKAIDKAWKAYEQEKLNEQTAPYGWDYETMIGD